MSSTFFTDVRSWIIPASALEASFAEMRADGSIRGTEGIALWLGGRERDTRVSHVVLLRGPGVVREPDFVRISDALLNDVTDETIRLGVQLVGQVHSHGPLSTVGLSWIDQTGGVRVPFYLSVVAPDFAAGAAEIGTCGAHIFDPVRGWRRMSAVEVRERIVIVADAVETITVGGPA